MVSRLVASAMESVLRLMVLTKILISQLPYTSK
jgi:hypothetical protein